MNSNEEDWIIHDAAVIAGLMKPGEHLPLDLKEFARRRLQALVSELPTKLADSFRAVQGCK